MDSLQRLDGPRIALGLLSSRLQRLWHRMRARWLTVRVALLPSKSAQRGAGRGALLAMLLLAVLLGWQARTGLGLPADILLALALGFVVVGIALLALRLLASLNAGVSTYLGKAGVAVIATALLICMVSFPTLPVAILATVVSVVIMAVLGGTVGAMRSAEFRQSSRSKKNLVIAAFVLTCASIVALIVWLAVPGRATGLTTTRMTGASPPQLQAPDPTAPGSFVVESLSYGAGANYRRPEFGAQRDLLSRTVDARPFVRGLSGWKKAARNAFWGFGPEAYPLNGRVWHPREGGPYPLVLVVHGNHHMADYSDPGYEYLGRHLASRGYIVVSVDENFLNGSAIADVPKENDARGWLLLEHVKLWRDWNDTGQTPFRGKVDLQRIALIGHSRGGEAVAHAAAFNRLRHYPDDATVPFDYGFAIKSLVAIAPVDGQYRAADSLTPLSNVNYLTFQGGHDADLTSFLGDRQFNRVKLTDTAAFKASVYVYRANHGQFNTVWGDTDQSPPTAWLLNRSLLLSGEDQRRVALVYITSFLESTLKDDARYRPLFRDHRSARAWLPQDLYITRYEDSRFRLLSGFDEDVDVSTTTAPGGRLSGMHLTKWRELDAGFRSPRARRETNVVMLGWKRNGALAKESVPQFQLELPPGFAAQSGLNSSSALVFQLAATDESPDKETDDDDAPEKSKEAKSEDQKNGEQDSLDMTVELVTQDGRSVRLPLAHFRPLLPPLIGHFTKARVGELFSPDSATEPVFQTFELPLSAFTRADPQFQPANLALVRLVFDRTAAGVVLLDRVGFSSLDGV